MNIFINSIFWILVLLVSVLGLISNKDHENIGYFPMYMNALLVAFAAVASYELSLLKTKFRVNYKLIWPILILLMIAITLFNSQLHVSSIWLDEYTQAINSLHRIDLVHIAAQQQQPPLFYMMTSLSMNTFGLNEVALRGISLSFTLVSVCLIFLILVEFTQSRIVAFIGAFLFLTNPFTAWNAVEGRPYAMSILFMLFFLYFMIRQLSGKNLKYSTALVTSCAIYLQTINFQSITFLLSVLFTGLCLYYFLHRKNYIKVFVLIVFGLISCLPIYYVIFQKSENHYMKENNTVRDWPLFLAHVESSIQTTLQNLGFNSSGFYISMLLLAFAAYSLFSKNRLVQFMNLLTIVFVLFNTILFEIIIKWSYQNRYGLIVVPLFAISFGLNLNEILIRLKKKWLYNASFSFCFIYLVQFPNYEIEKYFHGADWKSIYAFFRNNAQKNSVAYTLLIQGEESWFLDGFMAFDFYPQQNTLVRKFKNKYEEVFPDFSTYIIGDLKEKKEPSEIYFVHNRWRSDLKLNAQMFENQGFEYFDINNSDLIRIKNTSGLFKSTLKFYELVERKATHSFSFRNIYQGLLKLYIYDSNCKAAKQAYEVLLKIYSEKDKEFYNDNYRRICNDG